MEDIIIGRYKDDPEAQGVIRPESGKWQLVLDADGYPHLYVAVNVVDDEGTTVQGLLALDDLLPKGMTIRDIMDGGDFGGKLDPSEADEAFEEFKAERAKNPVPCPR